MTTPLAELLAAVPAINDPSEPYTFTVEGDTIVGTWNIVHAQFVEFDFSAGTVDKDYRIVVAFNEDKDTYEFTETKNSADSALKFDDGKITFGGSTSTFKGKSSSKSFSFQAGGVYKTDKGVSPSLSYSFETSRIKDPLFEFLKKNGWSRKKGLLGGLFNR